MNPGQRSVSNGCVGERNGGLFHLLCHFPGDRPIRLQQRPDFRVIRFPASQQAKQQLAVLGKGARHAWRMSFCN
jgi:hypothetical protein